MALRLLIQTRGLDGHGELTGGRPQGLDLAPVRAPLVGAVIADLEHAGGAARLVAAHRGTLFPACADERVSAASIAVVVAAPAAILTTVASSSRSSRR